MILYFIHIISDNENYNIYMLVIIINYNKWKTWRNKIKVVGNFDKKKIIANFIGNNMVLSIRLVALGHPVYRKDAPSCRQTAVHEAVEVVRCRRRLQIENTSILSCLMRFISFFFFCLYNILFHVLIWFIFYFLTLWTLYILCTKNRIVSLCSSLIDLKFISLLW